MNRDPNGNLGVTVDRSDRLETGNLKYSVLGALDASSEVLRPTGAKTCSELGILQNFGLT